MLSILQVMRSRN